MERMQWVNSRARFVSYLRWQWELFSLQNISSASASPQPSRMLSDAASIRGAK
jgi:hypothetical protein